MYRLFIARENSKTDNANVKDYQLNLNAQGQETLILQ